MSHFAASWSELSDSGVSGPSKFQLVLISTRGGGGVRSYPPHCNTPPTPRISIPSYGPDGLAPSHTNNVYSDGQIITP